MMIFLNKISKLQEEESHSGNMLIKWHNAMKLAIMEV
jgi:hypothetical protein